MPHNLPHQMNLEESRKHLVVEFAREGRAFINPLICELVCNGAKGHVLLLHLRGEGERSLGLNQRLTSEHDSCECSNKAKHTRLGVHESYDGRRHDC